MRVWVGGKSGGADQASFLSDKQSCVKRPGLPGQQQRKPAVSAFPASAVGCLGGRREWSPDSHTIFQGPVSLTTGTFSIFKTLPGPIQTIGSSEVEDVPQEAVSRLENFPPPRGPDPCPLGPALYLFTAATCSAV